MKCLIATLCLGVSKEWLRTLLVAIGYFPKDILKREAFTHHVSYVCLFLYVSVSRCWAWL